MKDRAELPTGRADTAGPSQEQTGSDDGVTETGTTGRPQPELPNNLLVNWTKENLVALQQADADIATILA